MPIKRRRIEDASPDVILWYDNLAQGSVVTAKTYFRRLGWYEENYHISPMQLEEMSEADQFKAILRVVSDLSAKGHAGSYIESIVKALKSWLAFNGKTVTRSIKIRGKSDTPTLREEKVPTQPELRKLFLTCDLKARASAALVAHAGLRLEVLGDYLGEDGLQVRDIPGLNVKGGVVDFGEVPAIVVVRSNLSKAGHQYFSFLGEEACGYLKEYLESRIRDGEILDGNSPIITPKQRKRPFIRTPNISDSIKEGIKESGFNWRPYVLRSYFDSQLLLAESHGKVIRDYRVFWMGHKGDIEHRYTLNKARLQENIINDMRESYRRSQEYLETGRSESDGEERLRDSFRKQMLLVAGFTAEEIERMDLGMDDASFQETVRKRLTGQSRDGAGSQRVVSVGDVDGFLSRGWGYVASLPGDRIILRGPSDFSQNKV